MKKLYDPTNQRLVFIERASTDEFWDEHWQKHSRTEIEKSIRVQNRFVLRFTQKYLANGTRILEGGCGLGQNVFTLETNGYKAYGIDYAKKTVSLVRQTIPELNVREGDIHNLEFENNFFDGYWFLGVIEHFFDGYKKILAEMHRVLKSEGILFLTVPVMSDLRKFKSRLGFYPDIQNESEIRDQFYQFALDPKSVIQDFQTQGFSLLEFYEIDGFKGLKDEIFFLQKPLQPLYTSTNILARILKKGMDTLCRRWTNHTALFVFQKQ